MRKFLAAQATRRCPKVHNTPPNAQNTRQRPPFTPPLESFTHSPEGSASLTYPRVFPLDAELANAVSGRHKHLVRSVWIAAAALGRANPLGHLTELQLPLADGHQEVHRHERASVQQWQDAPWQSLSLRLDEQCCSLHL